jgi:hypothetical protein
MKIATGELRKRSFLEFSNTPMEIINRPREKWCCDFPGNAANKMKFVWENLFDTVGTIFLENR